MTLSFRTSVLYLFSLFLVLGFSACDDDDGITSDGFVIFNGQEYDLGHGHLQIRPLDFGDSIVNFASILLYSGGLDPYEAVNSSLCLEGTGSRITMSVIPFESENIDGIHVHESPSVFSPGSRANASGDLGFTVDNQCSTTSREGYTENQRGTIEIQSSEDGTYSINFDLMSSAGETLRGEFNGPLEPWDF